MIETAFNILKVSAIIFVASVFFVAITSLINFIVSIAFANVVGEVIGVISCSLPFNALTVFGALGNAISAIFAFLIAKKIFDLTSWSISTV